MKSIAGNIILIAIVSVALLAFMIIYSLVYDRGIFDKDWFENVMMTYDMYTGIAATDMLLLKVYDLKVCW